MIGELLAGWLIPPLIALVSFDWKELGNEAPAFPMFCVPVFGVIGVIITPIFAPRYVSFKRSWAGRKLSKYELIWED